MFVLSSFVSLISNVVTLREIRVANVHLYFILARPLVDYFLKLVSKDVESYNKFYQEKLAVLPMVAHINSLFVMDEIKTTTELPL